MMHIDIYTRYKIKYTWETNTLQEEPDNFVNETEAKIFEIEGSKLINAIRIGLNECEKILICNNEIRIEHFNPTNGESGFIVIEVLDAISTN